MTIQVGNYVIERELRKTSNFADYLANHTVLGHEVRLRDDDLDGKWSRHKNWDAFLDARRLQAELHHPNIVPVNETFRLVLPGSPDGRLRTFTAFKRFAHAKKLTDVLRERAQRGAGFIALSRYMQLCEGLTSALTAIHAEQYLQGSLGKGVVYIDRDWNPMVHDLAFAVRQSRATTQGFGVPRYMAPEQLLSDRERPPTTASDLYGLGVILFEVRYGRHPVQGIKGLTNKEKFKRALAKGPVEFPRIMDPDGEVVDMRPFESGRESIVTGDDEVEIPDHAREEELRIRRWLSSLLDQDIGAREHEAAHVFRQLNSISQSLDSRPPRLATFIVMPFAGSETVGEEIRLACAELRIAAPRGDELFSQNSVWGEIERGIENADLVIAVCYADEEGRFNANVMVEVGFAVARGKAVLLVTDHAPSLPFDLSHMRAIECQRGRERSKEFRTALRTLLEQSVQIARGSST